MQLQGGTTRRFIDEAGAYGPIIVRDRATYRGILLSDPVVESLPIDP